MTPAFPFSDTLRQGNSNWKMLKKNWVISLSNKFVFVFFLLSVGLLAWRFRDLPPSVPLWFSKPWGEERLAHPLWLIVLPLSNILWYTVNRIFAVGYLYQYLVFVQVLFLTSLLSSFLSFVILVNVIFLVT